MLIEQGTTYKESWRTTFIGNTRRTISIDIIGLFPKSKDKNTIVVIVDQFTKMIRLKAITITVLFEDIAKIYQNNIWKLYRVSQKVLSDRGP